LKIWAFPDSENRLQAQGTTHHPQRYTGMWDVFTKTLQQEGPKGFYRGLTPNLLKVVPAVSIVRFIETSLKTVIQTDLLSSRISCMKTARTSWDSSKCLAIPALELARLSVFSFGVYGVIFLHIFANLFWIQIARRSFSFSIFLEWDYPY